MQLLTFQSSCHRNLITNLSYTDLLLALLQVSTRVCVLSDSLVFRTACDGYYLEKRSCRRPQRAAGLAAVSHVLPPPVGGAHLYNTSITPNRLSKQASKHLAKNWTICISPKSVPESPLSAEHLCLRCNAAERARVG